MSGTIHIHVPVRRVTLEAVVIRSNGEREELGVIAHYDKNPLRRLWWRLKRR